MTDHDWEAPFDLGSVPCQVCGIPAGQHDELPPSPPQRDLEPLQPSTGTTSARRRTVHVEQCVVPEPLRPDDIEVVQGTDDWCACGWSDEPHLRNDHEPAGLMPDYAVTPPSAACDRFISPAGEFATGPNSICDKCGASGRAHGIDRLGPPSQIAEALTPLED